MRKMARMATLPAAAFRMAAGGTVSRIPGQGSPPRPEPRSGRRRARLLRLLPCLALLLGALGPFAAAPAQAQETVWSAKLTVWDFAPALGGFYLGCADTANDADVLLPDAYCEPSGALTDDDVSYGAVTNNITYIWYWAGGSSIDFNFSETIPDRWLNSLTFRVDGSHGSYGLKFSPGGCRCQGYR